MINFVSGRRYAEDTRDRLFALPLQETARTYRFWPTFEPLDQGETPQCVAYSTGQWLTASPVRNTKFYQPGPIAPWLASFYKECQREDEWEGEDYEGTSVRASFKLLKRKGFVSQYRWAWDAETVARHILEIGPVVVGTAWYQGMSKPKRGYLSPSGILLGGHAYTLVGFSRPRNSFRVFNSWGKFWGSNGRAWINFTDMNGLLRDQGEACTAWEVDKD